MDDYDYNLYDDEPYLIVENREGNPIAPFLVGLALGAGIALLLAPQSGEETRREIAAKARRAKDAARDAVGELGDVIDVRRRRVSTAFEAGRVAARQAREELEYRLAESKAAHKDS